MRVLLFTFEYVPFAGGIATYSHEVALGLGRLGHDVTVLAPSYPDAPAFDRESPGRTVRMSVEHGGVELFRFVPGTRDFIAQVRATQPDVALLTSDLAHGIGGVVAPRMGIPFVPVVHGSEVAKHFPPGSLKERFQALPLRRAYRRADAIVCVSGYVRSLVVGAGFDPARAHVIHNGIDRSLIETPVDAEGVRSVRSRWSLGERPVMLTIARIVERKGHAAVLEALPAIRARIPDVAYVVTGTGSYEGTLRARAYELGVRESVVFTGEVDEADKRHLLDACDLFVMPSKSDGRRVEGLGISLLEAGARGKPLIGGRHGGVPEIVRDDVTGYLVDPERPTEVAECAMRVLGDDVLRNRLGEGARATVRDGFLTDHMAPALAEVLEGVVRDHAARDAGADSASR